MAAPAVDKVMQLVEKQLHKDPKTSNADLFKKAQKVDAAVGKLTLRQFHAKYPLQVKRRLAPKKPKKRGSKPRRSAPRASRKPGRKPGRKPAAKTTAKTAKTRARSGANREAVRGSLLRFARDISSASNKVETIEILANIDKYVDEVLKAAGSRA